MKLSEFINKRLAELGMKRSDIVNKYDLEWSTLSTIDHGASIRSVTVEKLAKALQCTRGDIQACIAEQNPLKKVIVSKKSLAKLNAKKEASAPDPEDEEPAEVFSQEEPEADEKPFPVYHSVYEEYRQEGEDRYKQKLRDMCLRIFSSGVPGVHTMEKIYADIGYALVKELASSNKE